MKQKFTISKLCSSFTSMFKRMFVREKLSLLDEEAIQTPLKTILRNFARNKLGMIGLVAFMLFLGVTFIGSAFNPILLTYTELPNANLKPGTNYLDYPKELEQKNILKIVSGVSFSVALTDDGKIVLWGTEPNQKLANVSDFIFEIPESVREANIVDIAAGGKHIIALDDKGVFHSWGYYAHGQARLPQDIAAELEADGAKIEQLLAATMWSAIVTSDKQLYIWGSTQSVVNFKLTRSQKGHIVKAVAGDNNIALLLDDGSVSVIGDKSSEYYTNIPEQIKNGEITLVDIASTNRNVLALDDMGNLHTWGSAQDGVSTIPKIDDKVKSISSGYRHFAVVTESGNVIAWGANALGQTDIPEGLVADRVFSSYFQNYAVSADGKITPWGHRGYIFGSDEFGRDMLGRLMHGGRVSLTVGAIATVISTVIALIVGLSSGYFGGWIDHLMMRVTDVFSAIPFYPIAVTLSYAVGNSLSEAGRLYLIMVILGILGWMSLARMIRAQLLVEREKDFVLAARSLGIRKGKIMWRHILPNVFNLVIVNITLGYANSLLSEAGLSFLGFGVTQPTPSWGNMLTSAQQTVVIQYYWWRWFIPGLCVVLAALSANLVGDALREAMDPRGNER